MLGHLLGGLQSSPNLTILGHLVLPTVLRLWAGLGVSGTNLGPNRANPADDCQLWSVLRTTAFKTSCSPGVELGPRHRRHFPSPSIRKMWRGTAGRQNCSRSRAFVIVLPPVPRPPHRDLLRGLLRHPSSSTVMGNFRALYSHFLWKKVVNKSHCAKGPSGHGVLPIPHFRLRIQRQKRLTLPIFFLRGLKLSCLEFLWSPPVV
ncbi:hypothetical protein OBBRIDRAFT_804528 [Obba rivulosa]|uniref:Uncharacterized protein n=1 Tax=Obba rivulosa TaxID=1052685 RepID=A0A8E2AX26_9APHY|nr:hypothetical protein OBBRIDRAFT_804528 [Obba rivulosa]